jgi:hypothetical protein
MSAIWSMSKALQVPIDKRLTVLHTIPHTISFVIRKRQQIDSFSELPEEKRPPEDMIWDGTKEDLDEWFDRVFDRKNKGYEENIIIDLDDVE